MFLKEKKSSLFLEKAISENRNLQYLAVVIKENA